MAALGKIYPFAILALSFAGVALSQSKGEFHGNWKLDTESSELRALPKPPTRLLRVDHQGKTLQTNVLFGSNEIYYTDGKESRNREGDTELKSILKWEGSALLFDTIVNTPSGSYTLMDRWKLSRDGKLLRIRRQIIRRNQESESLLVYERE